jgi:hypothetical protein
VVVAGAEAGCAHNDVGQGSNRKTSAHRQIAKHPSLNVGTVTACADFRIPNNKKQITNKFQWPNYKQLALVDDCAKYRMR